MSFIVQVGCFLVVLGCISGTGHAENNAEFTAKAREMLEVYANPSADKSAQSRKIPELAEFYEKYNDRIDLTDLERQRANDLLRRYKAEKAKEVYVDGVPQQGGFFTALGVGLLVSASTEIGVEVYKRATSSCSTIQISREMGICSILLLIALYKIRSKL
ncbi:protein Turandot E-like [Drosophila gunungcola]|uniref:Protein Turandot E n=1 Tax=Drosophila gunungcola TaxID=103775 RepID=A0A9P9YUM6_9MUSC|nr:protein Turandot E-like [Drosophila gunungcola]KAI8043391.1 hypothetical protein M5D96_004723 [Drosophila gunungcola]